MKKIFFLSILIAFTVVAYAQKTDGELQTQITGEIKEKTLTPARVGAILDQLNWGKINRKIFTASGTNTYVITEGLGAGKGITEYQDLQIAVKFTNGSTGASTLNINGIGAVTITGVISGTIVAGKTYDVVYNGTTFEFFSNPVGTSGGSVESVTGDGVDNTDPNNPVLTFPTTTQISAANIAWTTNTQTANYTGQLSDRNKVIEMDCASPCTFTLPTNAAAAFGTGEYLLVRRANGGAAVTYVAPSGGTLDPPTGGSLVDPGEGLTVTFHKRGTNAWDLENGTPGGASGVETVQGDGVDNSDPANPVLIFPVGTEVAYSPTGNLSATTVEGAINELDTEKEPLLTFTAADFNETGQTISLDYANGQAATSGQDGFLQSADWTTFNDKVGATRSISTTGPLAGGGDFSANRTFSITQATGSVDGYVSAADFVKLRERRVSMSCSDLITVITTGTTKAYYDFGAAFTITSVRATIMTAQTSGTVVTIDINEANTTILSTPITIDNNETSSATAATPAVISDTAIAANARVTIDFDAVGTGGVGVIVEIVGFYN
jgi:hypothetical protein